MQARAGETKMPSVREKNQNTVDRNAMLVGSLNDPGLAFRG